MQVAQHSPPSQQAAAITWRCGRGRLLAGGALAIFMIGVMAWCGATAALALATTPVWAAAFMALMLFFILQFAGILAWVVRLLTRPALIADEAGLVDLTPLLADPLRLSWDDIAQLVIIERGDYEFLLVIPHDPVRIVAARPLLPRLRQRWAWRLFGERPVIAVSNLMDRPLEEIASSIAELAGVEVDDRRRYDDQPVRFRWPFAGK